MGDLLSWFTTDIPHVVISWAIIFALSHTALWLWARHKVRKALAEQREHEKRVEDLLDTRTPGGLYDVVKAVSQLHR